MRILARAGRLDVVDDGPGIAPGDLEHAFERFYLYERYGGERPVGTGLGLAIVRELAEAMGGSVAARSEEGAGSTFSVLLPAPRGDAARPPRVGPLRRGETIARADGAGSRREP